MTAGPRNAFTHSSLLSTRYYTALSVLDLGQQIVLLAEALDQGELGLDPVDVLFLGVEDVGEQFAADVVADRLAVLDRFAQQRDRFEFEGEVAGQQFARVLADAQLAQRLEVRQAV